MHPDHACSASHPVTEFPCKLFPLVTASATTSCPVPCLVNASCIFHEDWICQDLSDTKQSYTEVAGDDLVSRFSKIPCSAATKVGTCPCVQSGAHSWAPLAQHTPDSNQSTGLTGVPTVTAQPGHPRTPVWARSLD